MTDPPDKRYNIDMYSRKRIIYLVLLAIAVLIAWWITLVPEEPEPYVSLEVAFYYQPNIVYVPKYQVLGTVVSEQLYKIIKCESNFQPDVCNGKYGCSSGMGLCQFIKSTWLGTIDRMGELLPERCRNMKAVFDGECNLTACKWLYETDGDVHWRAWSGDCWDK